LKSLGKPRENDGVETGTVKGFNPATGFDYFGFKAGLTSSYEVVANRGRYTPDFNAIFKLAHDHGASRQATAWRFVEEQDEAIALLQYYSSKAVDEYGNSVLAIWRSVGSPEFLRRFPNIDPPITLRTGHPWVAARDVNRVCSGNENLMSDGAYTMFEWHSWWNSRALCILIRRKPLLSIVGGLLRPN
jgi:hypothetical protein